MSLPTPPGTAHRREKDNRPIPDFDTPSSSRVAWAEQNEIHMLDQERLTTVKASGSKTPPKKSILKRTATFTLLPAVDENQREETPEPEDPLVSLEYLEGPISRILAPDPPLRDLIESYSILTARMRSSVSGSTDADASWPLFQPIRKNREAFVNALKRDLGRALEDPLEGVEDQDPFQSSPVKPLVKVDMPMLPSPQPSPRKKRGMSAERVKYARDLCTTCHTVLRLLALVFTLPSVQSLFTERQLGEVLTQVLAIPLADNLPTPNARKTCALSIWLIQVQRLPPSVLLAARERISVAIQKGIDGELGKEGKKGSISDGLKAIHDLCIHYPTVFVPEFGYLLPSVFAHLLGPTVSLRSQACHALGGIAYGSALIPASDTKTHTKLALEVARFLMTPPPEPETPSKKTGPDPLRDPLIQRTLRSTLKATAPANAATGPVWALCVLAHFVTLLKTTAFLEQRIHRCLSALFASALSHPSSSVRALACLVWRTWIWAYFQPPVRLSLNDDDQTPSKREDKELTYGLMRKQFKTLCTVFAFGAGPVTVSALLSVAPPHLGSEGYMLRCALKVLRHMARSREADVAISCVNSLLTVSEYPSDTQFELLNVLPRAVFSPNPSIFTVDFGNLAQLVKPLIQSYSDVEEVRCLTKEEIASETVWKEVTEIIKDYLYSLRHTVNSPTFPTEVHEVWVNLLKTNHEAAKESGEENAVETVAINAMYFLGDIVQDDDSQSEEELEECLSPVSTLRRKSLAKPSMKHMKEKKLGMLIELWDVIAKVFHHSQLADHAAQLLAFFTQHEKDLVVDLNVWDESHQAWAMLCWRICAVCEPIEVDIFFEGRSCPEERQRDWQWPPTVRRRVWRTFIASWEHFAWTWEFGAMLLCVPFRDAYSWEMSKGTLDQWGDVLDGTLTKASDDGADSLTVLDHIASKLLADHSLTNSTMTQAADILLSKLDITIALDLPSDFFEFINDTLVSSYPPHPQNLVKSIWLLRTLTNVIGMCPSDLVFDAVILMQEGLSSWISDQYNYLSEEYAEDLSLLYQTALLAVRSQTQSISVLKSASSLIHSAFASEGPTRGELSKAFEEFWEATYARMDVPSDGWPSKIAECLAIVYPPAPSQPDINAMEVDEDDSTEVEQQLTLDDEEEETTDIAPSTPVMRPSTPTQLAHIPPLPCTPRTVPRTLEPSRPHKTPATFGSTRTPPCSPLPTTSPVFVTPTRSRKPRSAVGAAAAHTLEDKENTSPSSLPPIPSVLERIIMTSPEVPLPEVLGSVLGKRRTLHESADDEEEELLRKYKGPDNHNGSRPPNSSSSSSLFKSRKRKGEFLEAVELPSFSHHRRRTRSLPVRNPHASSEPSDDHFTSSLGLRRVQSTTRLKVAPGALERYPETPKRRKRASSGSWVAAGSNESSSPLAAIREMEMAGSDDSITVTTPSKYRPLSPSTPSSDDEPFLGQVTPHRLVSPSPHKHGDSDEADPPSDDSVVAPPSPTTERIARMSGGPQSTAVKKKKIVTYGKVQRIPLSALSFEASADDATD
ncbi:hypothetical protein K474DRAFT_1776139 [Panus rudis PR-1116 ss-1]|nr:hypothetical protein K474DRAFT_1776139 [Panus rudis PR-1116 ss-1]